MSLYYVNLAVVVEATSDDLASRLADDLIEEWEAWPNVRCVFGDDRGDGYITELDDEQAADYLTDEEEEAE